jgi:hypothetical protein
MRRRALQEGAQQQQQLLFAVTDFKVGVFDIDLGWGFGMTSG